MDMRVVTINPDNLETILGVLGGTLPGSFTMLNDLGREMEATFRVTRQRYHLFTVEPAAAVVTEVINSDIELPEEGS